MTKIIAAVAISAAAILAAGCSVESPTVTTSGSSTAPSAAANPVSSQAPAAVGTTITLTGASAGEKMAVTVVQVFPNATGADEFTTPDAGKQFYAVQFRLIDNGSAAYSDAPDNSAKLVDASGQSYQSDVSSVSQCQSFPGTETIAPGATGLGCVVFQVPTGAQIAAVQFTLDSGFASQTGQWKVTA